MEHAANRLIDLFIDAQEVYPQYTTPEKLEKLIAVVKSLPDLQDPKEIRMACSILGAHVMYNCPHRLHNPNYKPDDDIEILARRQ